MHERRAMDGLRGRDRYRERCLARNVRKNQILGTYVWTPPLLRLIWTNAFEFRQAAASVRGIRKRWSKYRNF